MSRRSRRIQPRDVRGRYARIRKKSPPWWFLLAVVVIVLLIAYL
ncbi:hypothetical protein [Streptomyces sp. NPDC047841]